MAKLGTAKNPAIVRVQTVDKAQEVCGLCDSRGWQVIVGVEPDRPEDLADLEKLLYPPLPTVAANKPGRNDPCMCGSGRKYKKCCGANSLNS